MKVDQTKLDELGTPKHSQYKHGMHGTPTYASWVAMKSRCTRPTDPNYLRYGGSGIRFHPAWESFENFLADMGERPDKTSLDRIDGSKDYGPDNCRWATRITQNRNRKKRSGLPLHVSRSKKNYAVKLRRNVYIGTYSTKLQAVWAAMNHDISHPGWAK